MKHWPCLIFFVLLSLLPACNTGQDFSRPPRVPGVSDTSITVGSSLALTGHARYLGTQTLRGALSWIRHVNEEGGVHGRSIRVLAYDDSYDPPRCLANTQKLIIDDEAFALFCYVGTPTTVKILSMVEEAKIPLVGVFSGGNAFREPFNPWVMNIRASYYQETGEAIRHMVQDLGMKRIAVFYQYDAYGFDGLVGAELALKRFGLAPVARGWYIRGTLNVMEGLDRIVDSHADAVVMIGTYGACAEIIAQSQKQHFNPLFYTVSFVGAEALAKRLENLPDVRVVMSQVMPPPQGEEGPASDYIRLLAKYYPGEKPSYVGLEGFLNARIFVEGLQRAGRELTREKFIQAVESIRQFDVGGGHYISFGPNDHQGMDAVYFTEFKNGRFEPLLDWKTLPRAQESR